VKPKLRMMAWKRCGSKAPFGPLKFGSLNHAHRLGIGLAEPETARVLVKRCFCDRLLQHGAVEPEHAGLLLRQGTAELAANLLQPIGIDLPELVDRDLSPAHRGSRRLSEAAEDIGDAPDAETDDQNAHDHRHDGLAEPV
jgi:hypothetical protein